ncbi:DUF6603 domain-containing protein [Streptomyces sp. NPDC002994]|uniref:DUF6603 domain-containing protein n=1 Tax=Streptomyces sp. NPDC002994 TaxID=3154441 RepID=UPI0033B11D3B
MAIKVDELRDLLAGDGPDGEVAVPGGVLGHDGGAFHPLFEDGVLRVRREDGAEDGDSLSVTGSARTALADDPVPLHVAFSHNGGPEVTEVRLAAELPTPGASAQELGRRLDFNVPALPDAVQVSRLTLEQANGTRILTGTGERGRMALVSRQDTGRLLVAYGEEGGWRVLCADRALTQEQVALLGAAAAGVTVPRLDGGLPEGAWLCLPGPEGVDKPLLVPVLPKRQAARSGAASTVGTEEKAPGTYSVPRNGVRRAPHAIATDTGFFVLAPGGLRASWGRFAVTGPSTYVPGRSWNDFGLSAGASVSIEYRNSPLTILGGLAALPAVDPYEVVAGGVLVVDTGTFTGSAVAAAYLPTAGGKPSFFAFGALGSEKGIGLPAFQVRGIAGGMGWRSKIRLGGTEDLADFPFLKALDDPASIGVDPDGNTDPLHVLQTLTSGTKPWVTPAAVGEDPLWLAAGLAFTVAEFFNGSAMAVLQTGEDLTLALLGVAGMEFPKKGGGRKYAKLEIAVELVLKPKAGELSWSAAVTPNSYVLDPGCQLRGGVAAKIWFGPSPHRGDFVITVGGYHPNYRQPGNYPSVPRLGFDWDLSGTVTISGSAYLALTPAAVMGGGELAVRFHSGAVRAWLTAGVDALIQWKPFFFDVGIRVSVGVSASVKIWFVRVTITVEVGVSLQVWGPPTGGEAKIKLWFISFTVGFGHSRDGNDNALDWAGFRDMLPPPESVVRVLPGHGLLSDRPPRADGTRGDDDAWQVSSAGFTFSTDSAVPVSELYVNTGTGSPVETGSTLNIRPMRRTGLTSVQRVSLTKDGEGVDISNWGRSRSTAAVPQALWGEGKGDTLPAAGEQVVPDQLTGAQITSPGPEYGNDTGYITEEAFKFDPIDPDGIQPLDTAADPAGPVPRRQPGVIDAIARTVAAPTQTAARTELAAALTGLGFDLGQLDADLSAHADAAEAAFAAEPMLVPAS